MTEHTTTVAGSTKDGFYAVCTCGWEEDVRHMGGPDPLGAAEVAGSDHEHESTVTVYVIAFSGDFEWRYKKHIHELFTMDVGLAHLEAVEIPAEELRGYRPEMRQQAITDYLDGFEWRK